MNRNSRYSQLALAVAAALVSTLAFAQDELDETVVTATRTPVALDAVGAPVIVISRNDIERSLASDVSELLQPHAGLEISRNGGPGQTTTLFTRGTESNHTVVLIDGVRINPGTIGGAALQNISPESIERIEIVKGPRSSLYGTEAIGGVVQMFTRGAAKDGFSAGATYGSNNTQQMFGDARCRRRKDCELGFGGSYAESEGMPDVRRRRRRSRLSQRDRTRLARISPPRTRSPCARAAGAPPAAPNTPRRLSAIRRMRRSRRISRTACIPSKASTGARTASACARTLSHALDDIEQRSQASVPRNSTTRAPRRTNGRRAGRPRVASARMHSASACSTATRTPRAQSFGTVFDEDTTVTQAFVQDQFEIGRAQLAPRARRRRSRNLRQRGHLERGVRRRVRQRHAHHAFRRQGIPRARQHRPLRLRRQSGPRSGGFRARSRSSVRQKLGERQQLSLSAFDNRIEDLIEYVVTDFNTFDGENRNVERARIKGVELGCQFASEGWRARAELTLQDPRDETTDERLLRRSRESLMLAVSRDVGALDIGMDIAAYGNRKDFGFPTNVTLDSYTLVNATLRYRVNGALTLQGRLENLFDEDYTYVEGYHTEGRSYTIGVRYSFD